MSNIHIKRLHHNIFDVFLDNGFNNWVRVRRNHYGVAPIRGVRVNRATLKEIANHRVLNTYYANP